MNFSESKKISQCIFTTLIKVLKFVKKKTLFRVQCADYANFLRQRCFARAARATRVDQPKNKGLASS